MNLLETILNAQNGEIARQLANNFQLNEAQTRSAMGELVPALGRGIERNTRSPQGLNDLMGALTRGNHSQYLDNTSVLSQKPTLDEGNKILGHIFGNKQTSRQVASRTSEKTGIDSGILKKMLPLLASVAMGALSKQGFAKDTGHADMMQPSPDANQDSGLGDLLTGFLDTDKDGSSIDDILDMASKFLR